jgi:hypothetical protein
VVKAVSLPSVPEDMGRSSPHLSKGIDPCHNEP